MTTTSVYQKKPDFYYSKDECVKGAKDIDQTNPRYKNFKQALFTAGDEDQFQYYRDATNSDVCIPTISDLIVSVGVLVPDTVVFLVVVVAVVDTAVYLRLAYPLPPFVH